MGFNKVEVAKRATAISKELIKFSKLELVSSVSVLFAGLEKQGFSFEDYKKSLDLESEEMTISTNEAFEETFIIFRNKCHNSCS